MLVKLDSLRFAALDSRSGEEIKAGSPLTLSDLMAWLRVAGIEDEANVASQSEDLWAICNSVREQNTLQEATHDVSSDYSYSP